MKIEEVMKVIEILREMDVDVPPTQIDVANSEWAIETAIAALEKQIAKKPLEGAVFKHIGQCPDCGQRISTRSASNNCQYCGQKIDWRYFD